MRCFRFLLAEAISLLVISTFCAAQQGDEANVIGEVRVERGGFPPHRIEVNLETRGPEHITELLKLLSSKGYPVDEE